MDETLLTDGDNTQTAPENEGSKEEISPSNEPKADNSEELSIEQVDDSKKEAPPDDSESDTKEGAPESYDFKQTEGQELDEAVLSAYGEAAKELNLSQSEAQKMLETMSPVMAQRQAEQIAAVRESWASDAKSDKEFGGDKLTENLSVAKKAMDAFGTPELTALLNDTGLGNHPEIIRAFYRAGMKISEDTFVGGASNPAGEASVAQRMYPSMKP